MASGELFVVLLGGVVLACSCRSLLQRLHLAVEADREAARPGQCQ
jgi:hypothetical protein